VGQRWRDGALWDCLLFEHYLSARLRPLWHTLCVLASLYLPVRSTLCYLEGLAANTCDASSRSTVSPRRLSLVRDGLLAIRSLVSRCASPVRQFEWTCRDQPFGCGVSLACTICTPSTTSSWSLSELVRGSHRKLCSWGVIFPVTFVCHACGVACIIIHLVLGTAIFETLIPVEWSTVVQLHIVILPPLILGTLAPHSLLS